MGKNMRNQSSSISLENSHPGCMWSILHVLHYNRWHHVKKMLPYRRHSGGRQIAVVGDPESSTSTASTAEAPKQTGQVPKQTGEIPKQTGEVPKQTDSEMENSVVEEKTKEPTPVAKVSRRYRIMSMFSEEMYKRRGQHRRSASCPIQAPEPQTNSTHQLDSTDKDSPAMNSVNNRPMITNQDDKSTSDDHLTHEADEEPVTKNKNCELCAAMLTASYLTKPNVNPSEKAEETRMDLSEQRVKDLNEGGKIAYPQESKQFLDALDIFNTRKEMFLKVMQDPKSPLANHLHSPQAFNSEKRLTKSESFPAAGPTGKNGEDSTSNQTKVEYSNNLSPSSPRPLKNQHDSGAVLKRFKNLRQKLAHVIRESRKEKQRILMDGFLHKIPYGHRLSKDPKETADLLDPSGQKCTQKRFNRTASLNESLDKYCRLFESSFNREAKNQNSENNKSRVEGTPSPSRSAPKKLARIQSLPDMRSYSFQGEYYPGYTVTPVMTSVNRNLSIGRSKFDDQKNSDPENQTRLDSIAESGGDESLGKRAKSLDDLANAMKGKSSFDNEHEIKHTLTHSSKPEKPSPDSAVEFDSHEDKTGTANVCEPEGGADSLALAEPTTDIRNIDFLHARVERKDSVEFNYVKDVLQVAGFGGTDFLGTWHTTGQPVDPSVFAEVGGCLLAEPDSSVNEEGDKCNHLLLFDLINEVLLEIHEKSFTYCPMPLTSRSDVHPMPVGYHVLEEVWANVDRYLSWRPEFDRSLDDAVSKDLARGDGWMNLQFEAECVGFELEDMIFDELLDEFIWE